MAIHAPITGVPTRAPFNPELLSRFESVDRDKLGAAIELMIAVLDTIDGDPDREFNGDELDGTAGEDDFYPHGNWRGEPGCPISDPGGDPLDKGELDHAEDYAAHPFADPEAYREQKRRIQRTRCYPKYRYLRNWRSGAVERDLAGYELLNEPRRLTRRQLLKRKRGMPRRPRA